MHGSGEVGRIHNGQSIVSPPRDRRRSAAMILPIYHLHRLILRARLYMLAGFAAIGTEWLVGIGAVSAIALISLGAFLRCAEDYGSEPGLWMLALLFGSLFFTTSLLVEFGMISDAVRGAPMPWKVTLDIAVALHFQWLAVRAMATVVVHNRRLTS